MLERFGLGNVYFVDGQAPMKLRLTQTGSPELAFDLDADLGPARLEITDFGWVKTPGREGHLEASGDFGDGIRVSRFRLDTGDLKATGAIDFSPEGEMQAAQVERLRFRGLADVAVVATRVGAGAATGARPARTVVEGERKQPRSGAVRRPAGRQFGERFGRHHAADGGLQPERTGG